MNALSVVRVAIKRLWSNKGLTLCAIVGLTVAVALISSVPLYTDAANFKVLEEQLAQGGAERQRPPFAFMYRYIGAWHGAVEWEDYLPVNEYITRSVPGIIGLPVELTTQYVKTDNFSLFPASDAAYIGIRQPLGWVNLAFVEHIQNHIRIEEGAFPAPAMADADVIEVLVNRGLADKVGLQVGEEYVVFMRAGDQPGSRPVQFQLRVSGVWSPLDEAHPFWFYSPRSFEPSLLVSPETYRLRVAPSMSNEVYAAIWYIVFDGQDVRTDDVPGLLGRIAFANTRVSSLLANTTLDISPVDALQTYRWTTFLMTIVLYVFSIPILGLVLYFIGVISGLVVTRQRGEIAILKSRGAGDFQVLGIYLLEGLLIGAVGLGLGLALGRSLALVMGNTISFLSFGQRVPLPVVVTPRAVRLAILGIGIALLASLLPAMQAARLTIVTYKQDRARSMQKPFWQRFFLDFLLLIPCAYGYYVLSNRGTIGLLGDGTGDPFQDPLLFLVPALTIFAVSLIIVRLFPLLMELIAWFTSRAGRSVAVVLAFRQLARVSRQYTGSLLLLVLTLSLATFTASMARTLDQSLLDRMYYRIGADYSLVEVGEPPPEGTADSEEGTATVPSATESGGWVFVPVSEHLKVDGIEAATRVGVYRADALIGRERFRGTFYGIDRLDFPSVAFFRRDFASNDLGTLMNRLALDRSALLVSPNFLSDHQLRVGDHVELRISAWGGQAEGRFIIADVVRYFPTWYQNDTDNRYLFVGNLEYLFEKMGGLFPYDVWVRTSGPLDVERVRDELYRLDINVLRMQGSREAVEQEQWRPERTGVFGILSVGFVAAAILTVLGFLLHSFISFRQRYIEFGVLRAIGLSVGQMIGFLGVEQFTLILTGTAAGMSLGVWVSNLFIPFLQVGAGRHVDTPPFVVLIAWDDIIRICLVFGVMLLCAVAGMIWFLLHLRIFEAVKLGEAV